MNMTVKELREILNGLRPDCKIHFVSAENRQLQIVGVYGKKGQARDSCDWHRIKNIYIDLDQKGIS
jgi:hypothetical protein